MKTFKDLEFRPLNGGRQGLAFFENGYGISIVRHAFSYTSENTWEVAVLKGNKKDWDLCYDTPITDDVIGWQTDEDVTDIMAEIQSLPEE